MNYLKNKIVLQYMIKTVVIWANCQGGSIHHMLKKYYSHMFLVKCYSNYDFINNKYELPNEIANADIFLFQNYSDRTDEYDLNTIKKLLKDDCVKICFPTLHSCRLLFCYETDEPNNKTRNETFPFGKFFFGISTVRNLVQKYNTQEIENDKNIIIDEIYDVLMGENAISNEEIEYHQKRSFDFLEKKILTSDIPELFDFIKNNFTKVRLWHNPNHPTGILLNELVSNVFKKMNLNYDQHNEIDINTLDNSLKDWEMPIFPCVKKYHNMNFPDCCSSWFHKDITNTKSYITKYLNELYFTATI
jgi:hypothetical protein